jgi:hypothetical protein
MDESAAAIVLGWQSTQEVMIVGLIASHRRFPFVAEFASLQMRK